MIESILIMSSSKDESLLAGCYFVSMFLQIGFVKEDFSVSDTYVFQPKP